MGGNGKEYIKEGTLSRSLVAIRFLVFLIERPFATFNAVHCIKLVFLYVISFMLI